MREEAANNWAQAQEDLETARILLEAERFYASVFFSQQAAEKALKALHMQKKREIPIERAILFGSRARGDHLKHSDVNLLLVSDDFRDIPFPDRPSRLYRYWEGRLPLEMLCYTISEFEKKRRMIGIVRDAVEEGIPL
jgi:hypothetical protein